MAAQITYGSLNYAQKYTELCAPSSIHSWWLKSLINSSIFADILLSHTDRHTEINTCIKYSLKCLCWQRDSGESTQYTHIHTDPQAAISRAP